MCVLVYEWEAAKECVCSVMFLWGRSRMIPVAVVHLTQSICLSVCPSTELAQELSKSKRVRIATEEVIMEDESKPKKKKKDGGKWNKKHNKKCFISKNCLLSALIWSVMHLPDWTVLLLANVFSDIYHQEGIQHSLYKNSSECTGFIELKKYICFPWDQLWLNLFLQFPYLQWSQLIGDYIKKNNNKNKDVWNSNKRKQSGFYFEM